jgi:dTDP-glucose 4,6-dehydratase
MRIVITGGAGFIGSHLVDYYIARGVDVLVIDNLITGKEENISTHFDNRRFMFRNKDVCSVKTIDGAIDAILHFACPASPFDYLKYPIETLQVMSVGTRRMLDIARVKHAKFFLASTSEVYGDPDVHPQKEEYCGNVNVLSPRAVYDEGKRFAETVTVAYHRKYNTSIGIIRIFNTYGERMRPADGRVIPTFISEALANRPLPIFGDGSQTRSFCYIKDMVQGIAKALEVDYHLPLNLGNPAEYTILQVADLVKKLCTSTSELQFMPLPDSDPKKRKPDISRAQSLLQWQPSVDLEQGLVQVIAWFRERRRND